MGKRRRVAAGHEDILSDYECKDQMDIFDFIEPRPEDLPMKDYLTRLGFKNEYFERPDHECEVEVADIHEYPKLHFFNARYKRNPISGIFVRNTHINVAMSAIGGEKSKSANFQSTHVIKESSGRWLTHWTRSIALMYVAEYATQGPAVPDATDPRNRKSLILTFRSETRKDGEAYPTSLRHF